MTIMIQFEDWQLLPQSVTAKERPGLSLETERLAGTSRWTIINCHTSRPHRSCTYHCVYDNQLKANNIAMKSLSINSQYLQLISTSVKIELADNCQFIKPNFCLLHVCHHMYEPLKGHDSTWLKARQEIPGITLVSAIKTSNRLCVWLSHWVGHQHHLLCVNNSFLWCISSTDPLKLYIRQSHFQIFKNKDNNNKDHDLIGF